jgi:hypothetical protein
MLTESKLLERIRACTLAGETTLAALSDHFDTDHAVVWSMLRKLMDSGKVKEIADNPSAAPHYVIMTDQAWKAVYTTVERAGCTHHLRIGVAHVQRDGSLSVRLDAMPVSGQLVIRNVT